jgi:hypothetical protein
MSTMIPGRLVIDDNSSRPINPEGFYGHDPRDYSAQPIGFGAGNAGKFPDNLRIPRKNWPDLIRERKAKGAGLRRIRTEAKVGHLDQARTNYCWGNGPTQAYKIWRAASGLPPVNLCAASGCAIIKNYRNVGGWGSQFFTFLHEKGICSEEFWPQNYFQNSRYDNEASRADRENYRLTEYWDFEPRDIEAVVSSLLLGLPGAAGLNWWSHEVCYVDVDLDAKDNVVIDADNSWKEYGDNGAFYLSGSKMIPDDYCCIRGAIAA